MISPRFLAETRGSFLQIETLTAEVRTQRIDDCITAGA